MNKAVDKVQQTAEKAPRWSEMSDEQLLLRYRDHGDRQAFTELSHRYERELFSYLRRYLGDPEMAEDAFQTTFLQVHLKCGQFEDGRSVRPWLYTIATHQAIDAQRRNKRHRGISLDRAANVDGGDHVGSLIDLLTSREPKPDARLESAQQKHWVRGAVERLPEALRVVVNLVYYQGLKYREAADVLGIPVGTVKSRMHAALLKLNEAWNEAELTSAD